jgi:hypothetical protein
MNLNYTVQALNVVRETTNICLRTTGNTEMLSVSKI